jgi:hypothetical protein
MLQIFPFLAYLAALTSIVLLVVLWMFDEIGPRALGILLGWLLIAGYCQFFGQSAIIAALGLLMQTLLAVSLLIRWRFGG